MSAQQARIREGTLDDLPLVLRHRPGMFRDMGFRNENRLRTMEAVSSEFFAAGLRDGTYHSFFAADEGPRPRRRRHHPALRK